ncbi:MAG: DUF5666 domain-containing protein [Chloroflexota bacterium]|nr:DUF5666 domain-containing protein [Chloroflexota bacterium]
MKTTHYDAVEVCMAALETGVDIESCLALYADMAEELRPVLEAAVEARRLAEQEVPTDAMIRSRTRMLARAAQIRSESEGRRTWWMLPRLAFTALALVVALILAGSGLFAASAQALPGDALYSVKRTGEEIRKGLVAGAETKRMLEETYNQRRIEEVSDLFELGRVEQVSFEGVIDSQSEQYLVVAGIPVMVTSQTEMLGDLEIGEYIEVEGATQDDGFVMGGSLQHKRFELVGWVEAIGPDEWKISGVDLHLVDDVGIRGGLRVGDHVIALVEMGSGGTLYVFDIQLIDFLTSHPTDALVPIIPPILLLSTEEEGIEVEFTGIVEVMGVDTWTVSGITVFITSETEIDDGIEIGDVVDVEAVLDEEGEIIALEIDKAGDDSGDDGDDLDNDGDEDGDGDCDSDSGGDGDTDDLEDDGDEDGDGDDDTDGDDG